MLRRDHSYFNKFHFYTSWRHFIQIAHAIMISDVASGSASNMLTTNLQKT